MALVPAALALDWMSIFRPAGFGHGYRVTYKYHTILVHKQEPLPPFPFQTSLPLRGAPSLLLGVFSYTNPSGWQFPPYHWSEPFPTEPNHPALNFCFWREPQLTLPKHPLASWVTFFFRINPGISGKHATPPCQCWWSECQFSHTTIINGISVLILPPAHRSLPLTSNILTYFSDYKEKLLLQLQWACCLWSAGSSHVTLYICYMTGANGNANLYAWGRFCSYNHPSLKVICPSGRRRDLPLLCVTRVMRLCFHPDSYVLWTF